jgi:hypothetical protein
MKKVMKAFTYKEKNDTEYCKFIFDIEFKDVKFYVDNEGIITDKKTNPNDKEITLRVSFGENKVYVESEENSKLTFKENKYVVGKIVDVIVLEEITHGTSYKSNLKYFYKTILLNNEERILLSSTYEKDSLFLLTDKEFKLI